MLFCIVSVVDASWLDLLRFRNNDVPSQSSEDADSSQLLGLSEQEHRSGLRAKATSVNSYSSELLGFSEHHSHVPRTKANMLDADSSELLGLFEDRSTGSGSSELPGFGESHFASRKAKASMLDADSSKLLGVRESHSAGRRAQASKKFRVDTQTDRLEDNGQAQIQVMTEMAKDLDNLMDISKNLIDHEKKIEESVVKLQQKESSTRIRTQELADAMAKEKAMESHQLMQLVAAEKQSAQVAEAISSARHAQDLSLQQSLQIESQKKQLAAMEVELKAEERATETVAQAAYQIAQSMTK